MKRSTQRFRLRPLKPGASRVAFTLIELLVVMTILLVLTTFTAVAIDFAFEAERVKSGARQVQSMLQGARDRAIHSREPRGVRFIVEQSAENRRMVSSMVYVGATDVWSEGTVTLRRVDGEFPSTPAPDGLADGPNILIVDGSPESLWVNLMNRGYLGINEDLNDNGTLDSGEDLNGNGELDIDAPRIKIPGNGDGTWYTVATALVGRDPTNPNRLVLTAPFLGNGSPPDPSRVLAYDGPGPDDGSYKLELPPRILPGSRPILLAENVVIDLDASRVPAAWRPHDAAAGFQRPYASRMDLMFSRHGTVFGAAVATGQIHFYVGERDDVLKLTSGAIIPAWRRAPVNGRNLPAVPVDRTEDANGNGVLDLPSEDLNSNGELDSVVIGDRAIVSVVPSTGKITSQPINYTDADGNSFADDPYRFAETEGQR